MAYSHQARRPMTLRQTRHSHAGTLAMPRRRGVSSGALLVLLGIWGGIIPFIGPMFGYRMDNVASWTFTWDRLWLNILPGAAALIGGLILIGAADRVSATVGAALAVAGGVWFLVGPSFALLWSSPVATAGIGVGSNTQRFIEQIGYFYGLGAVVTALAAAAWARLMVRSERDAAILERGTGETVTSEAYPAGAAATTDPYADGTAADYPADSRGYPAEGAAYPAEGRGEGTAYPAEGQAYPAEGRGEGIRGTRSTDPMSGDAAAGGRMGEPRGDVYRDPTSPEGRPLRDDVRDAERERRDR